MYIFRIHDKKNVSSGEKWSPYIKFNLENPTWRSSHWRCSTNKLFLKLSQNSQKNTRVGVCFLIKLQVSGSNFIIKQIPTQMFFSEFCEKNLGMFFYRVHPGDCFWMCLLFFDFRSVLQLPSVQFGVVVMLGCRAIQNCQHLAFFHEFLNIFCQKMYSLEKFAKILEDMLS